MGTMTKRATTSDDRSVDTDAASGFSAEERAAMKERSQELKAGARKGSRGKKAEQDAAAVLEKIAEMPDVDRILAERLHELVTTHAPVLAPKLWYGMPAYAKDGKVVCFFQASQKFSTRYSTLGFSDTAQLDTGTFWPTAYALTELTPDTEAQIIELVTRAVS